LLEVVIFYSYDNIDSDMLFKMRNIFIIFFLTIFLSGCGEKIEWSGFIYPDINNLTKSRYIGKFDSIQSCRDGCSIALKLLKEGTYECGLNCKEENGVSACEKTSL